MTYQLLVGDCLEHLKALPDNSVDAAVTDPPGALNFMDAEWDSDRGGRDFWVAYMAERFTECLRVLKPGAHALVWAAPRTSHWTAWSLESAGFDICDTVLHLYGQGFPKGGGSLSKKIDKGLGYEPTVVGLNPNHRPTSGVNYEGVYAGGNTGSKYLTAPTSAEAKQWEGWHLFLKPASEIWWLVQKPFKGSSYRNVLTWGTGALNIDACRIPTEDKLTRKLGKTTTSASGWKSVKRSEIAGQDGGRYPAHVIVSHNEDCEDACTPDCAVAEMAEQKAEITKYFYCPKPSKKKKSAGLDGTNTHPTVKSVELMSWLVKLVTPPAGSVLDPFCGSGSTGVACVEAGFQFTGIELFEDFAEISRKRIEFAVKERGGNGQENRPEL